VVRWVGAKSVYAALTKTDVSDAHVETREPMPKTAKHTRKATDDKVWCVKMRVTGK
jgi:hypothetical protein